MHHGHRQPRPANRGPVVHGQHGPQEGQDQPRQARSHEESAKARGDRGQDVRHAPRRQEQPGSEEPHHRPLGA